MEQTADINETLPLADRLLNKYGEDSFESISFDKGFSDTEDRELLKLYIPEVIMSKKGRLSQADKERESSKKFTDRHGFWGARFMMTKMLKKGHNLYRILKSKKR
jgi:hypothetical protein